MMNTLLKIIKNRSDIGAGTRGADLGIDALEIAAINADSDFFNRHPFVDVETHNETIYNKVQNSTAKRIHFVAAQCERLKKSIVSTMQSDFFPLVLSGDHSSALGTMAGIKSLAPSKQLGVIWIDAHADIHSPYSTPSGNIHGMPLAAALAQDHLDLKINDVSKNPIRLGANETNGRGMPYASARTFGLFWGSGYRTSRRSDFRTIGNKKLQSS